LTDPLDWKNDPVLHLLVSVCRGPEQLVQLELAEPGAGWIDFLSQDP
jgi:hypothetical protein